MRVLVIAAATYADPHTRKVFDRLAEKDVEIVLAMPRRIKHSFGPADVPDTPWPTPGVRLVRLDTWYSHENGTHIVMKGIPRLIREVRPEIIHCVMEPWSLTCLEVLACLKTMRRRPRFGVQPAETKPEQGGFLARHLRQRLYSLVVSRCDYFVGWSSLVVDAASRLGLNGQPTVVAPAVGVDTELFRPADPAERSNLRSELGASDSDFLVGFVGRFTEDKGVLDLVRAVEGIRNDAPGLGLMLLGAGPLEKELRVASVTLPWIRLFGPRDLPGVASFIRALDVLVLPSRTTPRTREQFGLVLVEAMASGVPVIGSNSGAIPDVIGNMGEVVREGDLDSLAQAILRVTTRRLPMRAIHSTPGREGSLFADATVASSLNQIWRLVT